MRDAYLDWEELVGTAPAPLDALPPPRSAAGPDLDALLELDGLPEELRALVERRIELRHRLDAYGGPPSQEVDARDAARFEVPAHTVETRIAERRERRRDESAHLARLRRQQQRLLERQREAAEAEARRRRRGERVALRRRSEQDELQATESERRRRQAESLQRRWELDRRESAERRRAETRRREQWAQQRQHDRLAASLGRVLRRRDEDHRLEARLDRRDHTVSRDRDVDRVSRRDREVPWEVARDRRRDARREARP